MASQIQCFLLEPTEFAQVSLRRYSLEECKDQFCHNALVNIGTSLYPFSDFDGEGGDTHDHSDPRWPQSCSCGYVFQDTDSWQYIKLRLFSRGDHLALRTTLSDAPPGAMWLADWYPWKGPDGQTLIVKTPAGEWLVDAPSEQGTSWTRVGDPPEVTITPSIHFVGQYHAILQNGVLIECDSV